MEGQTGLGDNREESSLEIAGRQARIVPAWRWLLEPEPS
jgi:hypothetical protein